MNAGDDCTSRISSPAMTCGGAKACQSVLERGVPLGPRTKRCGRKEMKRCRNSGQSKGEAV
eukprot:3242302-Pyramimonas_sp.AAC.1